jgi:hypothetical protein
MPSTTVPFIGGYFDARLVHRQTSAASATTHGDLPFSAPERQHLRRYHFNCRQACDADKKPKDLNEIRSLRDSVALRKYGASS